MLLCEKAIRRWIKEWGQAQSSLPAEPALGNATQCQRPIWTGWQPTSTRWMRPCSSTRCRKFSFSSLGAATTAAQFVPTLSRPGTRATSFARSLSAKTTMCALCGGRTWRELIRLDLSFSMRRDGSWNAHSRLSRVHPRHARLQRPRSAHDGWHLWGFNHQGPGG